MSEVIIYQAHDYEVLPLPQPGSGVDSSFANLSSKIAKALFAVGIAIWLITLMPSFSLWARNVVSSYVADFSLSNREVTILKAAEVEPKPEYQPAFDPKLSLTNHLIIPSIGVDTDIQEATLDNYEEALRKGVWRVSDFGAPGENGMPVIMAAHRFGYLAWSNSFRRENSFFNLPKLKVGDTVQIVWHQRKYTYEIYAEGKGKDIMDYTANLILYTCENLTGEERVFKYAKLLEV